MPTAHISLDALSHNVGLVRARVPPQTQLLAAVKANAYGHGAVAVARHLISQGVTWLGVATPREALELRGAGVSADILIFSPTYENVAELVDYDVALTVIDERSLEAVEASGTKNARVHLKVDTGMGRLGLPWQRAADLAQTIAKTKGVTLEGVWTHFANSDDGSKRFTHCQIEAFELFLADIKGKGIYPRLVHAANSAAVFAYPESHYDLVRPGIALYGYHSSPVMAGLEPNLRPAMTLSAPVTFVKSVAAGTPVSYSSLWHAPEDTTVATVRIGYADGYPRLLSGKAEVLVHGQLRPVAGRVCMDQLMVDVGESKVQVGDRVTLFGPGELNAEALASRIGTISYELLTSVSPRVERVYEQARGALRRPDRA